MKRFIITIEKECTYEVEAENEDMACDIAEKMFDEADATCYIENEEEI